MWSPAPPRLAAQRGARVGFRDARRRTRSRPQTDRQVSRPFQLVEIRIAQANYFLGQLARSTHDPFVFHCHLSAFASACRSVTYVLQAVMSSDARFSSWYAEKQSEIGQSAFARYFNTLRRLDQHVGAMFLGPARRASTDLDQGHIVYSFASPEDASQAIPPTDDVLTACHQYYDEVARIVHDCCLEFRIPIGPQLWFTALNYEAMGEALSDAMQEVFGNRDADLPELKGEKNQWLLLRELVWSTDLTHHFDSLRPPDSV